MISPSSLLAIADAILQNHADEVGQRTATNRSYYGVFHTAAAVVDAHSLPEPANQNGNSHARLFNRLAECGTHNPNWRTIRSIGYAAQKVLKPLRVAADYHIEEPFDPAQAEEAVERARKILEQAAAVLPQEVDDEPRAAEG